MPLPKPQFSSADETSLKLVWDPIDLSHISQLKLEYKEPHQEWADARAYSVPLDNSNGVSLTEADVVDLKPGTAYFVRLVATDSENRTGKGLYSMYNSIGYSFSAL